MKIGRMKGDLIFPAQLVTPDIINFMAKYGRGLICLALTKARADELELKKWIDAIQANLIQLLLLLLRQKKVSPLVYQADRSKTIQTAIDESKTKEDISTPGHIFPLIARDGGVLSRAGHTEAAVDIARLAGLKPAAVICEIMNDDGSMARG